MPSGLGSLPNDVLTQKRLTQLYLEVECCMKPGAELSNPLPCAQLGLACGAESRALPTHVMAQHPLLRVHTASREKTDVIASSFKSRLR